MKTLFMNKYGKFLPAIFFTILGIAFSIRYIQIDEPEGILNCFGLVFLGWLPVILFRFKIRIPASLLTVFYFFIFLAIGLGTCLGFYVKVPIWDLILHFSFGFIGCIVGLFLLIRFKIKMPILLLLLFVFLFSMGCGAMWEVMEFAVDEWFDLNTQHRATTGLMDTMEDIIANFLGAVLFVFYYAMDKGFLRSRSTKALERNFERKE